MFIYEVEVDIQNIQINLKLTFLLFLTFIFLVSSVWRAEGSS